MTDPSASETKHSPESSRSQRLREERYSNFVKSTSETIWCIEFDEPIPLDLSPEEQLELCYKHARMVEVNEAWAQLYRTPREEIVGRWRLENFLPRSLPTAEPWVLDVIRSGYRLVNSESVEQTEEGLDLVFVNWTEPVLEDGKLVRLWGASRDVTHLRATERKLSAALEETTAQRDMNQAVLNSLVSHVAVVDDEGRILEVNESWKEFARQNGADPDNELCGSADYLDACRGDDPDATRASEGIRSVLEGAQNVFTMEYPCHSPSQQRWFSMSVVALRGESKGAVVAHTDVTELAIRQRELEKALEEIAELKDRLEEENIYLQEELREGLAYAEIVGESEPWLNAMSQVKLVAGTESTVLLWGETGTGKELLARALHAESSRRRHPMIKVNCAALPSTLIESELFGHEKGAFSGADRLRQGRFELADRGTLFLDEVGELPLELQGKLLHVLQTGDFERVGSSKTLRANVRVIAATNRDLRAEVAAGRFRSDLYYRLAVFPIEVPPLRERRDDIALLAMYFLARQNARNHRLIDAIPKPTLEAMERYDWPGNVRELENVIERAVILTPGSTLQFDVSTLATPGASSSGEKEQSSSGSAAMSVAPPTEPVSTTLEEAQRRHIVLVLESCGWRVKGSGNAAEKLGLKESTLRSRMKKLGIQRPTSA